MSDRLLITNVSIARMDATDSGYGLLGEGAVLIDGDRIGWVGRAKDVDPSLHSTPHLDGNGCVLTPALIDCHTHIVHGGNRAREFEMRLEGASYEDISRAGGGIISTVTATREANEETLLFEALKRADTLIGEGVGVIEIKSGYGLDLETELKMLRVARAIGDTRQVRIVTSFLGAHAVPRGMDADSYIDTVCIPALEAANADGLVDAVDGFCEGIAFNTAQIARVFEKARELELPVKLHAEQLSNIGGTRLAADFSALSADHVEFADEMDAVAMATSGSVAVLLPGAFYTLHETQKPPVDAFRRHQVPMAVATDWNPGSSPLGSLRLAMNMACTLFGLTPAEALAGTTCNAARALGLNDCGVIAQGMRADLALWDVKDPAELSCSFGVNVLKAQFFGGRS